MARTIPVRRWMVVVLIVALASCSGSSSACGDGTRREDVNELAGGSGAETREEAVRLGLGELDLEASDESIGAAVTAGEAGEGGAETIEVTTVDGVVVTMTLVPLEPGWGIERTTWCDPG